MQEPKYFFKFTEAFNDNGTVWYTMQIHTKGEDQQPIVIKTRYSQLRQIHQKCAETAFKNDLPDFPHKKLLGNTKQDFIQKRKKELQNYYNTLSKTIDIEKLTDLHKYIQSHRKKKVTTKPKQIDEAGKIQSIINKQNQLKATFQATYKEVLQQIVDLNGDMYQIDSMGHQDGSKRFLSEMQQMKPHQSQILADSKIEGIEQNETDYWSMFLKDEHEDFILKAKNIVAQYNKFQKDLSNLPKQSIVLAKS